MGESSGSDNKSNLVRQARHKGKRDGSFVEVNSCNGSPQEHISTSTNMAILLSTSKTIISKLVLM
jgi:hypothetical protein